jgi:DNA polymerase-3 subunit epsilon
MWWTGAALGSDTETDGPVPTEARIITAAMVLVTPGNPPNPMELMLQPERDIDPGAIAIHGITTERAREEGVMREAGIAQIATTIAELAGPEIPLVGHNVCYDLTLLDREMRRTDIGRIGVMARTGFCFIQIGADAVGSPFPVIDTYVLDKAVDRYRKGKRQLSFAAEHYGVPMEEGAAHGATADVFASLRIAYKIHQRCLAAADYIACNGSDPMAFQMHPFMRHYAGRRDPLDIVRAFAEVGAMSLPELHAAQRRWAVEQAEGLRDYFIKKGDTEAAQSVDGRWPVRPLDEDETVETVNTTLI